MYVESIDFAPSNKQKLRAIINHLKKFDDVHACQKYIEERPETGRIVLIVNGRLGRNLVPFIHHRPQISSVYVYCLNKEENEQWAHEFSKRKSVVTALDELVSQIQTYHIQQKVLEPLSIMYSTTEVKGPFVFSQCLIDCLLRMEPNEQDKNELIVRCMAEYEGNNSEKTHIHEFQTSYLPSNALWWYTRESFVYKTLNLALRKQVIHMTEREDGEQLFVDIIESHTIVSPITRACTTSIAEIEFLHSTISR